MRGRVADPRTNLADLDPMSSRLIRLACVVVVAALSTQGCGVPKKRTGGGTNLGGLDGKADLPPPGQPAFQ